jgi:hypothetical protein
VPRLPGTTRRDERSGRVVLGEGHGGPRLRGHRPQQVAVLSLGHRLELLACAECLLHVADREHDLDEGRQQCRPVERLARLAERPADRGRGGVPMTLREPQEGVTGLRLPSELDRLAVRGLGGLEVALQAMDLAPAVRRKAERPLVQDSLREARSNPSRLLERVGPRPAESHDLRPVDEAQAPVGDHVRLVLAPAREGRSPLSGPA